MTEKPTDSGAKPTVKTEAPAQPSGTVVTHEGQQGTLVERAKHLAESSLHYITGGILPSFESQAGKQPPPFETPTGPYGHDQLKPKADPIELPPFESPGLPKGFQIPKIKGFDPSEPAEPFEKPRWKPVPLSPMIPKFDPLNPPPFEGPTAHPLGKEPKFPKLDPSDPAPFDKPLWKPLRKEPLGNEPDSPGLGPEPRFDKPLWKPIAETPLLPGLAPIKLPPLETTPRWKPQGELPNPPGATGPINLPPFESTPLWPKLFDAKKILFDAKTSQGDE